MSTDIINWSIFNELVTMDEDEPGFSKSLIQTFIEQAQDIFKDIDSKLEPEEPDLAALSSLGHYLKGSAASLGLVKIQEQCERIQNYGLKKDFDGLLNDRSWKDAIKEALEKAREEFVNARTFFSEHFNEKL